MKYTSPGRVAGADAVLDALKGIVPSLNTPFRADLSLDVEALAGLVDHVIGAGCAGILACAVAGEGPSLTPAEYAAALETIVGRAAGRVPVIASASAPAFALSLARARQALESHADIVLFQAPAGATVARLEAMLAALAGAGAGILMLQDLDWHGPGLPLDSIVSLAARVPAFRAIKIETVPAGPKYTAVRAALGDRLHVSGGWAVQQMPDALARGVDAFMPTAFERIYVAIHRLHACGREADARALFEALLPLVAFANQHIDVSIRFFKHLRVRAGLFASEACRPPVAPLDAYQRREMEYLAGRAPALEAEAARIIAELDEHGI